MKSRSCSSAHYNCFTAANAFLMLVLLNKQVTSNLEKKRDLGIDILRTMV